MRQIKATIKEHDEYLQCCRATARAVSQDRDVRQWFIEARRIKELEAVAHDPAAFAAVALSYGKDLPTE